MKTWLGTALGSLIFGWAALVASPASAADRVTAVSVSDGALGGSFMSPAVARARTAHCEAYDFGTSEAMVACFKERYQVNAVIKGVYKQQSSWFQRFDGTSCTAIPDGTVVDLVVTSSSFARVDAAYSYGSVNGYLRMSDGTAIRVDGCRRQQAGVLNYNMTTVHNTAPGDDGPDSPDKPKECVLNAEWGRRGLPQRAAGYKPVAGNKFRIAYRTDFAQPATVTDGGATAPGHLFEVDMGDNHACTFRRQTRVHLPSEEPSGVGTMVYTADYFPMTGGSVGDQGSGNEVPEIVVKANTKVSKPIVKYGTAFDANRIARALDSLERAVNQRYGTACGANCRTTDGQAVPVTVEAKQEVDAVPFVHPAPAQLLRDNPDCVAKFDPRCAFNPSTSQPATPATPPNTLVRISNDGTNIVQNDTKVYNNTVYPQTMREAGTAPSQGVPGNTAPSGSVDSPGGAEEGEGGGGAMIDACRESGECTPSDEKVAAYLDAIGVDRNKDTSPDGVASSVIDKAMGNGTCTSTNQNAFCSLAAGFGARMNRPVPVGDLVIAEGDLKLHDRMSHQKITLSRTVLDYIKLLLKIMTVLSTIHIVLRGRPF